MREQMKDVSVRRSVGFTDAIENRSIDSDWANDPEYQAGIEEGLEILVEWSQQALVHYRKFKVLPD